MDQQDNVFRGIASGYVEIYGGEINRENENAEQLDTTRVERNVKTRLRAANRNRFLRYGALAACVLIAILVPLTMRSISDTASDTASDIASAPPDSAVLSEPASAGAPAFEPPAQVTPRYELIPLSFELPEGFAVLSAQQDMEKTVYLLNNTALDDVVLTLEKAEEAYDFSRLTSISLNGVPAYATANCDYKTLAFVKDEVLHIFTCKYELSTLINLANEIL